MPVGEDGNGDGAATASRRKAMGKGEAASKAPDKPTYQI